MRIKDHTDMVRHLTDSFNIPEARRMIAENPALTQEQFKAGGIVEPGVTHYAKVTRESTYHTKSPTGGGVPADDAKKAYIKKRAKQLGFDKPNFKEFPTRGYPSSMTAEQQLAKGYDEVITKGYKKFPDTPKRTFTTKEKNLIKNNFKGIDFNKGSYGVKYSENKKLFQNVVDFVERGFVKSTIEKLPSKDRKEIIEMFGDEWGKPFQFDDFRYGIPDSAGKNKNIAQRIRAYSEGYGDVKLTGPSWIRTPEGAILAAMKRAPDKYEEVLKGGKLAGYKNLETGETYFHKNYAEKLKAKEFNIINHPDYNKTLKFYNIAKNAKMPPTETIYKLFAKAGFDTKGLRFNDLLRYLTHTTDFTTTANAIEIHHAGTVYGKMGDLQLLRADLNKLADTETRRILKIADPVERAQKIKFINTQFKKRGIRSVLPDGTVLGVRKESAAKGLERIQKFVIEGGEVGGSLEKMTQVKGVKDWKAKDFNKFKTYVENIGCPVNKAAGGRIGFAETGSANCFNLGREKIKTGQIKPGAEESNFKKLIKAAKGVRGVARATGLGLAWEAAFAPIIVGWMGSEGESWERMKHELVYGSILEGLGVPAKYIPGESAEEELTKYMGKDAFDLSKIYEIYGKQEMVPAWDPSGKAERFQYTPGELTYLKAEEADEIYKSSKIGGEGYETQSLKQIRDIIKKREQEAIPLTGSFYEGPAGQHFAWDKLETADEALKKGLAELEAKKKKNIEEGFGGIFSGKLDPTEEMLGLQAGGRVSYLDGGIVSLLKK